MKKNDRMNIIYQILIFNKNGTNLIQWGSEYRVRLSNDLVFKW